MQFRIIRTPQVLQEPRLRCQTWTGMSLTELVNLEVLDQRITPTWEDQVIVCCNMLQRFSPPVIVPGTPTQVKTSGPLLSGDRLETVGEPGLGSARRPSPPVKKMPTPHFARPAPEREHQKKERGLDIRNRLIPQDQPEVQVTPQRWFEVFLWANLVARRLPQ